MKDGGERVKYRQGGNVGEKEVEEVDKGKDEQRRKEG